MPAPNDVFEMRRMEALSNTIFGVAMTLLAYNLPKASGLSAAPDWTELTRAYAPHVVPLMLSFIIAGVFWFSHQRRLAQRRRAAAAWCSSICCSCCRSSCCR